MTNSSEYAQWRLISNKGIRFRFLGMEGDFTSETGDVQWKGMIRAEDFMDFALEIFPPTSLNGNLAYSVAGTMPGWPNLPAKKLTFKSLDGEGGLPCDALQTDSGAPIGTYHGFLEITINFASGNGISGDATDPRTFLEITSTTGGEFIYSPPAGMMVQSESNSQNADPPYQDPPVAPPASGGGFFQLGPETLAPITGEMEGTLIAGLREPVRTPILPTVILVPTSEWIISWKAVPANHFRNVVVHRLRYLNGKVSGTPTAFLYNATPETLLFTGFDHQEVFSWKNANVDNPPINLDLKIVEKRVNWDGRVVGHNHVWVPGRGWMRAWIGLGGNEPLYRWADFNFLFKI